MNLASLILPLVGGYCFLSIWYNSRYRVKQYAGYRLFLNSAVAGTILLFAAKSILELFVPMHKLNESKIAAFVPTDFNFEHAVALVLGIILPHMLNRLNKLNKLKFFPSPSKCEVLAAEDSGNTLFVTIANAYDNAELIELTLNTGKVYIGAPTSRVVKLNCQYLQLMPYFSGYRDENTKKLIITSDYGAIFEEIRGIIYLTTQTMKKSLKGQKATFDRRVPGPQMSFLAHAATLCSQVYNPRNK